MIAVFKPRGLLTQPDQSGAPSLLDNVREYLRTTYSKPGQVFVGLLHRLDRRVSGVVLFAKTSKGASRLSLQFRLGMVKKLYHALVEGAPRPPQGRLEHYLARGSGARVECAAVPQAGFRRAILEYKTLGAVGENQKVEILLHTGRKHQIRAQMAAVGCPIVNDTLYGAAPREGMSGIELTAVELEFDHPITQQRVKVGLP